MSLLYDLWKGGDMFNNRIPLQVAVAASQDEGTEIVALASDKSMWYLNVDFRKPMKWRRLPDLPDKDETSK